MPKLVDDLLEFRVGGEVERHDFARRSLPM
jgi:hypothetical protein